MLSEKGMCLELLESWVKYKIQGEDKNEYYVDNKYRLGLFNNFNL